MEKQHQLLLLLKLCKCSVISTCFPIWVELSNLVERKSLKNIDFWRTEPPRWKTGSDQGFFSLNYVRANWGFVQSLGAMRAYPTWNILFDVKLEEPETHLEQMVEKWWEWHLMIQLVVGRWYRSQHSLSWVRILLFSGTVKYNLTGAILLTKRLQFFQHHVY